MIGPGKALDTNRYFVICINSLGSFFGSTGPASIDPATGKPYRLGFPDLSVEDIARGGYEVARSLGIERVDTVMGPSLGGMTVLAYVAQFPGAARRLVDISGTAAASPFAIALRSIQREAILLDPQWKNGNYAADALPVTGMRIARMLGMMTYRSAAEWRERFSRQLIAPNSDARSHLRLSSRSRGISKRMHRSSCARSIRAATSIFRARWTGSILLHTAARMPR